ncbi:hypothetical protein ABE425_04870 [Chryseobacterium cucumeris]|uniref:hypothetical protein n=1 Tax=Chryseobacterium cucumeris TaxID=1813611 RepID=UPI003207C1FC
MDEKVNEVHILKQELDGCPMIWYCEVDGISCYLRYRWGIISLNETGLGLLQTPIMSDKIGNAFDGIIDIEVVIKWLESKDIKVINKIVTNAAD